MQPFDVIVIGDGVGGLSCAMTLASAHVKRWWDDRRVLLIGDGRSDLEKARLFNAPGITPGTDGTAVLQTMREQLAQYPAATHLTGHVVHIERCDQAWNVVTETGDMHSTPILILATGYKRWEFEGLPVSPAPHPRGGKPDRISLQHDGVSQVSPNLHVAGLLGGGSSQFAIAAGIGAQVAVEILSKWAGKRTHVHDLPERPE